MVPLGIFFWGLSNFFFIYSFKLLFQKSKSKTDLQKLKTNYFILYVSLQVARKPICTLCFQNSSICELVLPNASCDGKIKTDANNFSRKQSKLTWFRVRLFLGCDCRALFGPYFALLWSINAENNHSALSKFFWMFL